MVRRTVCDIIADRAVAIALRRVLECPVGLCMRLIIKDCPAVFTSVPVSGGVGFLNKVIMVQRIVVIDVHIEIMRLICRNTYDR